MATIQITLPDDVLESLKVPAAASGTPTVDEYIAGLIDPNHPVPITPELKAELKKAPDGPFRTLTDADWDAKVQALRSESRL